MTRLLAVLVLAGLGVWGLSWLADNPGTVSLDWRGAHNDLSVMRAFGWLAAFAAAVLVVGGLLRFVIGVPGAIARASRARSREKGMAALARGMIAVGAGDAAEARRHAAEADRRLGDEPLTRLLRAQAAQLSGDRAGAAAAFHDMLESEETRLLGLRGLHIEARRAGESDAALEYARKANADASLPWAAQAVLDDLSARGDWAAALAAVDRNAEAKLIDRATADRWRAALKTALAEARADRDPRAALALAREAHELAPTLAPAAALCGRLTAHSGDLRRAARLLENAWRTAPHPAIATVYVDLRPGDATGDRLIRAQALARLAPDHPESALTLARAALDAHDLAEARRALAPLVTVEGARPTRRACLLMAEIEGAAENDGGVREWLARAARAPRDPAWVAEGIVTDRWSPAGPGGALDAFVWRTPDERLDLTGPELALKPAVPPPPPAAIAPAAPVRTAAASGPPAARRAGSAGRSGAGGAAGGDGVGVCGGVRTHLA